MCNGGAIAEDDVQDLVEKTDLKDIVFVNLLDNKTYRRAAKGLTANALAQVNSSFWAKDIDVRSLNREAMETLYGGNAQYISDSGKVLFANIPDKQPLNQNFTPGALFFASSTQKKASADCSLYFTSMYRLRLRHDAGPADEESHTRYVVIDPQLFDQLYDDHKRLGEAIELLEPRHIGRPYTLFEWDGAGGKHPSRGRPVKPPKLTQYQINLLYLSCSMRNNGILEQCLSRIKF